VCCTTTRRFVHRQDPARYFAECRALGVAQPNTPGSCPFTFGAEDKPSKRRAQEATGYERQPVWPPPAPGSAADPTRSMDTNRPIFAPRLVSHQNQGDLICHSGSSYVRVFSVCGLRVSWALTHYPSRDQHALSFSVVLQTLPVPPPPLQTKPQP
jgi:hypothetical protein